MMSASTQPESRLTVLLTEDRQHAPEHWTHQLPRLMQPMGVRAQVVRTGREAVAFSKREAVHAAVVDLLTPAEEARPGGLPRRDPRPGGLWLLEMFRRGEHPVPVVVVSNQRFNWREGQRYLNEALRLGAFSVINQPVELETLLEVIRRLLDRRYAGAWPRGAQAAAGSFKDTRLGPPAPKENVR